MAFDEPHTGLPLVGRDAVAYAVLPGGIDVPAGTFTPGVGLVFLGIWKDIKFTYSRNWSDVTPSSNQDVLRRRTTRDFKASLNNLIRSGGSYAMALALASDYIQVSFTEEAGGAVMLLVGGIQEGGWNHDRESATDNLEIIGVGFTDQVTYNGVSP